MKRMKTCRRAWFPALRHKKDLGRQHEGPLVWSRFKPVRWRGLKCPFFFYSFFFFFLILMPRQSRRFAPGLKGTYIFKSSVVIRSFRQLPGFWVRLDGHFALLGRALDNTTAATCFLNLYLFSPHQGGGPGSLYWNFCSSFSIGRVR